MVSYGVQCALPGWPGVYTRISFFADWIDSVINAEPKPSFTGRMSRSSTTDDIQPIYSTPFISRLREEDGCTNVYKTHLRNGHNNNLQHIYKDIPGGSYHTTARVDGAWSEWSQFSDCLVSCGSGVRERTRSCVNPLPANGGSYCLGPDSDTQICQGPPCFCMLRHVHALGVLCL